MAWHPPMIKWKLTTLKYTKKSAISRTLLAKTQYKERILITSISRYLKESNSTTLS